MEIHADGLMDRSISVALLPQMLSTELDLAESCSVVIDVLRATSVMVTAGHAGVEKIFTCQTTDQAHRLASTLPVGTLLCGERDCKRIEGFQLGNSPAEYGRDVVAGRELVLTTTNGTRAINAVLASRRLLAGSFLNLDATLASIANQQSLQIVCAGTNGEISYEDVLLAGAMVERLTQSQRPVQIDDSARIARAAWRQMLAAETPLKEGLRQSRGGRNLMAVGFEADIDRCANINTIDGVIERVESHETAFQFHAP